jgi:nucleotide-binding universal stress UspA family protein
VAAVLAASAEATVLVVHVVRRRRDDEAETALSHEIVDNQAAWGRKFGAKIETLLLDGEGDPELLILQAAREREVDLIIVGSSLRVVRARAFYGDRIEHILRHAPCPVAIVSAG